MAEPVEVELRPCPFCGKADFLLTAQVRAGGLQWWAVECGCHAYGGAAETEAEAVTVWNTRFEADLPAGEGDVREALTKVRDGYASQMKFADIEAIGYFREFIRRIDAALAGKDVA